MKLARKLALALILGIVAVMAVYAYVQVRHEVSLFQNDLELPQRRGHALLVTLRANRRDHGQEQVRELVSEIGAALGDRLETRWVRVNGTGDERPTVPLSAEATASLAAGEALRFVRQTDAGELHRFIYVQLAPEDPTILEASESLQRERTFINMSHATMLLATILVAAVCGLIALALLEQLPLPEAKELLRKLAAGAPDAWLTRASKQLAATLDR